MRTRRLRTLLTAGLLAGLLTGCDFAGLQDMSLPGGPDLGDRSYEVTAEFVNVLGLAEREAYAGGLGLDEAELRVVGLGARPGGEPVRQQAAVGVLELERTHHEGRVDHRSSQEASRVSSPSTTRSQVSSEVGAPRPPWPKAPAASSAA